MNRRSLVHAVALLALLSPALQVQRRHRRSAGMTSTLGDGFGTPFVAIGSYPPDERGTYRILPRGVIRLAYADGPVKRHTIAIFRNGRGRPDPTGAGVLLDETNFYTEAN